MVMELIIYILAVYGGLVLSIGVFGLIRRGSRAERAKLKLVLIVKNAGDCIEYAAYSIVKRLLQDKSVPFNSLSIINMDSDDETSVILSKLRNDYASIELLNGSEKQEIFKEFL